MSMYWALVFFGLTGSVFAQMRSRGHCPRVNTMKDFDVTKFNGVWNIMELYGNHNDHGIKCFTVDFSLRENGTAFVGVFTSTALRTGIQTSAPVLFRAPNPNNLGKLKSIITWNTAEEDWWVLDTDYVTYAIFLTQEQDSTHLEEAKIATREIDPSQDVMAKVDEIIKTRTLLDRASFKKVSHDNCEVQPL